MSRLVHSSKALAVLIAMIGMLVLAALGRISFDQLWLAATILIGMLTAATAYEDGSAKRASGVAVSVRPPPRDAVPTERFLPRDPRVPSDLKLPSPAAYLNQDPHESDSPIPPAA